MTSQRKSPRLLILVPTPREAAILFAQRPAPARVELVGMGVVHAAAGASRAFARFAPDAAILLGTAGTFDPDALPIGAAMVATRVACDGIGTGEGARFRSFEREPRPLEGSSRRARGGRDGTLARGELLTVCASAGSPAMAAARRRRHPRALAEEMEGYAVAIAAEVAGVPLTIVRGSSNLAGDRVQRRWRWDEALAACRDALDDWIARNGGRGGSGR